MTFRISIVLAALAAAAVAVTNGGVQGTVVLMPETALLEHDVNGVAMVGGDANEAAELPKSDESEQLLPPQDSPSGRHLMEDDLLDYFQQCPEIGPVTDYWVPADNAKCYGGELLRNSRVGRGRCCEDFCNGVRDSQGSFGSQMAQYNDHTCFLYNPVADLRYSNCYCLKNCVEGRNRGRGALDEPGECYVTERKLTQCTDGPLERHWVQREGRCKQGEGGDWLGSSYTREVITSAKCCREFCHQFHPATTCISFSLNFPNCRCFHGCNETTNHGDALCASTEWPIVDNDT